MKIFISLLVAILFATHAGAQPLKGIVFEEDDHGLRIPLEGASVYFPGTATGTTTGPDGRFELTKSGSVPDSLVFSYIGFVSDTLPVGTASLRVILKRSLLLKGVEIKASRPETFISQLDPIKMVSIPSLHKIRAGFSG